jgi:WD40-like Beta Propeller Repeat
MWSPDGSKLVYEELNVGEEAEPVRVTGDERMLWMFSLTTAQAAPFAKGFDPSWSPNGARGREPFDC